MMRQEAERLHARAFAAEERAVAAEAHREASLEAMHDAVCERGVAHAEVRATIWHAHPRTGDHDVDTHAFGGS